MPEFTVRAKKLRCTRCAYEWTAKFPGKKPGVCANRKCKSPYWDRPRRKTLRQKRRTAVA